jgi:hypothetical protein
MVELASHVELRGFGLLLVSIWRTVSLECDGLASLWIFRPKTFVDDACMSTEKESPKKAMPGLSWIQKQKSERTGKRLAPNTCRRIMDNGRLLRHRRKRIEDVLELN